MTTLNDVLDSGYREMAADTEREKEASEWLAELADEGFGTAAVEPDRLDI